MIYRLCDLLLESEIALPGGLAAEASDAPRAVWRFALATATRPEVGAVTWYQHHGAPDQPWLSLGKCPRCLLLRFHRFGDFELFPEPREIVFWPAVETPLETISHLLFNQVAPLLLGAPGRLVLHASAVAVGQGAIAFVAPSGRGKSTLAASFAAEGHPLIADDCLVLDLEEDRLMTTPAMPSMRLWSDSAEHLFGADSRFPTVAPYSAKSRVDPGVATVEVALGRLPLRCLYFLSPISPPDVSIHISPLPPRDLFAELVSFAFKLDPTDRQVLQREFALLSRVATRPIFHRLSFPHDYAHLPAVRQAIYAHSAQRSA
jgi:hypothetical protein